MQKVVLIGCNGETPKTVQLSFSKGSWVSQYLNDAHADHQTLIGLLYKDIKLGMFVGDRSLINGQPLNKWATQICQYLIDQHTIDLSADRNIYGPVIVYADTQDMTTNIWDLICETIKSKKKGVAPDDLVLYTKECEAMEPLLLPNGESLRDILQPSTVSDYGRII